MIILGTQAPHIAKRSGELGTSRCSLINLKF
jgi:hypothetical protein